MTLSKNFLHKEPNFIKLSRFRLIVGGILGLLYSFSFYSFLYIIRESFRILSVTEKYDLWVLTDKEVNFYNLFFAFLSVIIGQSVCFVFWFDQPKKIFGIRNFRKTAIVHEQRFLNWYFLSWFSKIAVVFGLFFGFTFHGSWHVFSLFPDYNFVFIFIIIVLFFQTWNTLRLTYIRKSLKWILTSIFIVSILSYGLSKINLTNYNAINESILSKNIQYNYKLDLPTSDIFERPEKLSLLEDIYVVCEKDDDLNTNPIIIADNKKISLDSLPNKINYWRSARAEIEIPFMIYRLYINGGIKMDFINKLKTELSNSGVSRISYAVIPSNSKFDNWYYPEVSFPARIPNWNSEIIKVSEIEQEINKIPNIIEIKQNGKGIISINDSFVDKKNLKTTVKQLIAYNPNYLIKYYFNDSINFSSYFKVVSESTKAVHELRNEYSQGRFSQKYNWLNNQEQNEIREKFPVRIIEFTEENMSKNLNK
jgi:hypothetical protein